MSLFTQKRDKKALQNHSPLSSLPICRKNFERLLFNEMFKCLTLFHQVIVIRNGKIV